MAASDHHHSTAPEVISEHAQRRIQWWRRGFLALAAAFILAGALNLFGSTTATATASGSGYRMSLDFPSRSRSSLPIELKVTLAHPGGFPAPVRLAVNLGYLNHIDFNNLYPTPSFTETSGDRTVWTFPARHGDSLVILMDARIQPGSYGTARGRLALLDNSGSTLTRIDFATRIAP